MIPHIIPIMFGSRRKENFTVVVEHNAGSGGEGYAGYIDSSVFGGPIGSINPTDIETHDIKLMASGGVGNGVIAERDFYIQLDPTGLSKDLFYAAVVHSKNGTIRTYFSADASFLDNGGDCFWRWGDGTDIAWDSGEDATNKQVTLIY